MGQGVGRRVAGSVARASLRHAAPAAAPVYAGTAIASAIIFGPTGMTAADVAVAAENPAVRATLWAGWLILVSPVGARLVRASAAFWVRSLPAPAWWSWSTVAALLIGCQLPWMWLWARGVDLPTGIAHGLAAAALHTTYLARQRTGWRGTLAIALAVAVAAAVLVGAFLAQVLVTTVALGWGARQAWSCAPEHARAGRSRLRGRSSLALAMAQLRSVWRGHVDRVARALLVTALGAGLAGLVARNNALGGGERIVVSMAVAGAASVLALAGIARAIVGAEQRCRWLIDASGAGPWVPATAAALAMMVPCVLLAGVHVALVAALARPGLVLIAELGAVAVFVAALHGAHVWLQRWAAGHPDGEGRALAVAVAVMIVAIVAPALLGVAAAAIAPVLAAGVLAWVGQTRPLAFLSERTGDTPP